MKVFPTPFKTSACVLAALVAVGCATDDPNRRAKAGAAIGAATGAVIGHQVHDKNGRFFGAAIGALAGGAVGNYQDKQQRELERALAEEQRNKQIEIRRLEDDTIAIGISSDASFGFDSSELRPNMNRALAQLASTTAEYDQTIIHVVGHTDSVGKDAYNMGLSKRRAQAVAQYLSVNGVAKNRLRIDARGESEPRSSNSTEEGRNANRRVELHIKPVVEGQEERALERPA